MISATMQDFSTDEQLTYHANGGLGVLEVALVRHSLEVTGSIPAIH